MSVQIFLRTMRVPEVAKLDLESENTVEITFADGTRLMIAARPEILERLGEKLVAVNSVSKSNL